ncbi:MAG: prepilin-type N-terminal cleavage/methylation domain-containing protein [Bdellovibrionales bacterium]|nr:prepilin-type N-terminal cleavage/methylation domain-containing protein [Bdellovibrionales bacterium]
MLRRSDGFTLIELMTTMSVLGILAAVALSHFKSYQTRAFDARAENDLHTAITAEEAYFADNESYVACSNVDCETQFEAFTLSMGTEITMTVVGTARFFQGEAYHPKGDKRFTYDSTTNSYTAS